MPQIPRRNAAHLIALLISLVISLAGHVAHAAPPDASATVQREPQLVLWQPHWRRFDWIEYSATALLVGGWAAIEFGTEQPVQGNWTGGILFDDVFRDWTLGRSASLRDSLGIISDYTGLTPTIYLVVDSILAPLIAGGTVDVAWQLTMMNIQAIAANGLLSRVGHRFIARARPDLAECEADPSYGRNCFGGPYASFPSGHASAALTAAGLTCAHHLKIGLYGNRAADIGACVGSSTLGLTTGVLRLIADRHYVSDVIIGSGLGFGLGFGLPLLLHYRNASPPRTSLVPVFDGQLIGLVLTTVGG